MTHAREQIILRHKADAILQQLLRHFTQIHKCEPRGGAKGKVRGSSKS